MKRARRRYEQLGWFDRLIIRWSCAGGVVIVLLTGTLAVWLESWEFVKLGGGLLAPLAIMVGITMLSPTDG